MLQTTVNRLHGVECESPVVICNEQHRFIVAEQLRQLNKLTENIIRSLPDVIPRPRSPAALAAKRGSPDCDPLMLVRRQITLSSRKTHSATRCVPRSLTPRAASW